MTKAKWPVGVASLRVLLGASARAQEAAQPQAAQPQSGPQAQQQVGQYCTGLGCLFGERPRPQAAQPQPAAQPSQAAAAEPAAPAKPAPKKPAKPVHVVTIAADGPEAARLQKLAAALPREKIKIVKTKDDGAMPATDFAVSTTLEGNQDANATKLFTEQMHIVAGGTIHSVSDLRDKIVSFGPEKSPSQAAARKAFEALNIKVKETPLDVDNALDGLATGDVDAVVLLAPQPIDRLKKVTVPGLHLVSWPEGGTLPDGASAATIDPAAYPALAKPGDTIRAMGVDATLTISAKGAKANAAKTFLKVLSQHSESLTKRGFDLLKADLAARRGHRLASVSRVEDKSRNTD